MSHTYTAKEVSAILDVPVRTLQRWVDLGLVISSAHSGGTRRRRYTMDDVHRARIVQALRTVPLRGARLRAAVKSVVDVSYPG